MFIPDNALERSLVQAATDPTHRPQFCRDLLASDVFFLSIGGRLGMGVALQAITFGGHRCVPIFSALTRVLAITSQSVSYGRMPAQAFLKMTRGDRLCLNPGSDYGQTFTPGEIADLLESCPVAQGSSW